MKNDYNVTKVILGHRKNNTAAGKLYQKLGLK